MRVVIVGGGISGLAAAEALLELAPGGAAPEVAVYEAAPRAGGKIRSEVCEGHAFEWGPNGFLDREPATLQLCERLGLDPLHADESAARRFLWRGGRLRELPTGPLGLLFNGTLPFPAAVRALGEYFVRSRSPEGESVHAFATRRLGAKAADWLVQAMVTGIHGGDAKRLEVAAAFPRLVEMERVNGGLIRALRAAAKAKKKSGGPSGGLRSFATGMETLVHALVHRLGSRLHLNTPVEGVVPLADGWRVDLPSGSEVVDKVILACPADEAARLVSGFDEGAAASLGGVPYAPLSVVCFAYRDPPGLRARVNGFGFLAPPGEGLQILGSIWSSTIFPQHAPEGWIQTRNMVGGAMAPATAGLPDEALVALVRAEQAKVFGIDPEPELARVVRWPRAIPQYVEGHTVRIALARSLREKWPGLALLGNAWHGVGVNDCVREASNQAREWVAQ